MSHFKGSSSLHIITASASNTKSVKLYRSTEQAEVTHTLPVHLKEGVNVVELCGVSAKIVNNLYMPVACSFQDPDAQPSHQSEHTTRLMSTQVRLIGVQVGGSTIRITIVSDTIYRQDVFVSYYLRGLSWDPYFEFHVTTTASPEGLTLSSIVSIHRYAIFEKHTGENWDGKQFPIIIADASKPPMIQLHTCLLSLNAFRAPAPGGGLFQSRQLPPVDEHASPSRRNEGDGDPNLPLLVTSDALQPRDDAAASLWNRRCADQIVQVAPVMSFPAQYEHVLSLNNFTMFNRRGPAITVECTIKHMSELEDVLMFPRDNTASIFVNGKFVDVTNPFELYSITNRDGSRTFPLCMDRKLTIEYPITFAEANTDDPLNSVEIWRHRAAPQDFQLLFPTHISAIISNENPFPVSVIVLNDVSWWEMPLKNLTCTIYSQPISCIDPTLGDSRIALPSIPAHAEILLEIEWEAPTQLMQSGAPNLVRATHQGGSDATSSNVEIRAV